MVCCAQCFQIGPMTVMSGQVIMPHSAISSSCIGLISRFHAISCHLFPRQGLEEGAKMELQRSKSLTVRRLLVGFRPKRKK